MKIKQKNKKKAYILINYNKIKKMFTFKFKQGFALDIEKTMKSYINSNYGKHNY